MLRIQFKTHSLQIFDDLNNYQNSCQIIFCLSTEVAGLLLNWYFYWFHSIICFRLILIIYFSNLILPVKSKHLTPSLHLKGTSKPKFWSTHCLRCWSCDPGSTSRGSQLRLAWRPRCALSSGCRHTQCWRRSWGCSEIWCCLHCWDSVQPGRGPGNMIYISMWQQDSEWRLSCTYRWEWRAGRGWQRTSLWGTGPRRPWWTLERN